MILPTIAFALATYAGRPSDYQRSQGWEAAEAETSAYFQPIATFAERLDSYLNDVRDLGFNAVDLWQPILDQRWVSDAHLIDATRVFERCGVARVAFAGAFGETREVFQRNCEICSRLHIPLLVGATPLWETHRDFVVDTLRRHHLRWAYEHEAERTPDEILRYIGDDASDVIGVCADTGWFGTWGYDAADALRQLASRLLHVHLKDVRAQGSHITCRLGDGVVDLRRCVETLQQIDYQGALVIEHETAAYDRSDDVRASLALLKTWLT